MKTKKKAKATSKNERNFVKLPREEYERLKKKAEEWEPSLPAPLPDGNYPAVAYARASLARDIIRHRRKVGLTQVELASLAGISPKSLSRIESALISASVATVDKIDKALQHSEIAMKHSNFRHNSETEFVGELQEFSTVFSRDDPRLEPRIRRGRPGDAKPGARERKGYKRKG